jgi:hypothetical protein
MLLSGMGGTYGNKVGLNKVCAAKLTPRRAPLSPVASSMTLPSASSTSTWPPDRLRG